MKSWPASVRVVRVALDDDRHKLQHLVLVLGIMDYFFALMEFVHLGFRCDANSLWWDLFWWDFTVTGRPRDVVCRDVCWCLQLFQLRERDVRLCNLSAEDLSKAVSELSLTAQAKVTSFSLFICYLLVTLPRLEPGGVVWLFVLSFCLWAG